MGDGVVGAGDGVSGDGVSGVGEGGGEEGLGEGVLTRGEVSARADVEGEDFDIAAQGDGEVCVTAIETALQGRFTFILREDLAFTYPRAETPTHYLTMGMDPDLDRCAEMALRDMIVLIGEVAGLSREDAYTLCSIAADLRVTQTVNGSKGIHCMLAK